jgi:hypothetical protein
MSSKPSKQLCKQLAIMFFAATIICFIIGGATYGSINNTILNAGSATTTEQRIALATEVLGEYGSGIAFMTLGGVAAILALVFLVLYKND